MAAVAKKCYYSNSSKIISFDFYSSRIAVDYANGLTDVDLNLDLDFKGIDLEAAVNQTEDSKIAMIKSIFDAKRQFIKALESTIFNASVVNLDAAFEAAQNGVTVSKTTISDLAERLTIENAQKAIKGMFIILCTS